MVCKINRVIILEEDLQIAPDFFELFLATKRILDEDESLLGKGWDIYTNIRLKYYKISWCVSICFLYMLTTHYWLLIKYYLQLPLNIIQNYTQISISIIKSTSLFFVQFCIVAISAWNDNGLTNLVSDNTALYRSGTYYIICTLDKF